MQREKARLAQQKTQEDKRLAAINSEQRLHQEQNSALSQQYNDLLERKALLRAKIQQCSAQNTKTQKQALEERSALDDSDEQLAKAQRKLGDEQAVLSQIKRDYEQAQNAARKDKEALIRAQTQLENSRENTAQLRKRLREEFGKEPQGVLAAAGFNQADKDAVGRDKLQEALEQKKRLRDAMGVVNLQAAIQSDTLNKELENMQAERQEITTAVGKLEQEIHTLNRQARSKLKEAFARIDQQFSKLFEQLFGGGIARLKLVEDDDPLYAGLEVFASPPGKKMQLLSLLSGGEQTMAAIALLFAVFLVNPAPVCVLDEVDAPLDESNVIKLCDLIRKLCQETQTRFILVTHNPVTMARVDRLYGVTMQEPGVSTLISLDLQNAEQFAEKAASF